MSVTIRAKTSPPAADTASGGAAGHDVRATRVTPGLGLPEEPRVEIDGRPARARFPNLVGRGAALGDAGDWLARQWARAPVDHGTRVPAEITGLDKLLDRLDDEIALLHVDEPARQGPPTLRHEVTGYRLRQIIEHWAADILGEMTIIDALGEDGQVVLRAEGTHGPQWRSNDWKASA